jgi:hypothetical protein
VARCCRGSPRSRLLQMPQKSAAHGRAPGWHQRWATGHRIGKTVLRSIPSHDGPPTIRLNLSCVPLKPAAQSCPSASQAIPWGVAVTEG